MVESMGRLLDRLYYKIMLLGKSYLKIINEDFIIGIFNEYKNEISPFKDYIIKYNTK